MHRLSRTLAVAAVVTSLVAAAGCSSGKTSSGSSGDSKSPAKVSYLTAFGTVGRDAFIWVAEDKGYFKDENIDIDIKPGAAADTNLKALSAGQVQFAALDFNASLVDQGQGQYTDVRAFAAIHQRNLSSIIGLDGGGITTPKDVVNKKIGVATGSVVKLLYPAYARLAGLDPTAIQWQEAAPATLPGLLAAGKVDGLATFLIGTPAIEKASGKKTVVLPFSQYLTDLYGNALFTTNTYATKNPDVVKRFRTAALKGLQYAIDHPDEAGKILQKYNPTIGDTGATSATGEIKLMTPYVAAGASLGTLDEQRVARSIAILQGAGLFGSGLTPDKVLYLAAQSS
jgi:NitT/TauT family transport system substrate-binding protein